MKFKTLIGIVFSAVLISNTNFNFTDNTFKNNTKIFAATDAEKSISLNQLIILRADSPLSFVYGEKRFIDDSNHNFSPVMDNNRVLLPVRFLSDCIGAKTDWDNKTMTATITHGNKIIKIKLNDKYMKINNKAVELDTNAKSEEGRIIVPARAIAEALNKEVYYNNGFIVISDTELKTDNINNIIKLVQDELTSKTSEKNNIMSEQEIYNKLLQHYKNGTEEDGYDPNLTLLEGSFDDETHYSTSVRCGVPGNPTASQRLYEIIVNAETGEVTQTNILFNKITYYNLND